MVQQDKKISLKVNSALLTKLEILAAKNDRTLSSMIRVIIKEYIEKVEQDAN